MSLSPAELLFYAKSISLPDMGIEGQLKLKNTKMLCIGAGGLGSSLLQTLASAGIGTIGIIDHDVVELSNLQRQTLYRHEDIGLKKIIAAKKYLDLLNPHINIYSYPENFNMINAQKLISQYDIIADCTDDLANRYLVNQYCVKLNKPFVFAGIWQHQGQCMLFHGKHGPCFECLFPPESATDLLADCSNSGVLNILPNLLGTLQANLIIQYNLTQKTTLANYFYQLNITNLELRRYSVGQNPQCSLCSLSLGKAFSIKNISAAKLNIHKTNNAFILLDVRSREEHAAQNLGDLCIPLPELSQRITELNPDMPIIIYCKSGKRSMMAARILSAHAFTNIAVLEGGIEAYKTLADT